MQHLLGLRRLKFAGELALLAYICPGYVALACYSSEGSDDGGNRARSFHSGRQIGEDRTARSKFALRKGATPDGEAFLRVNATKTGRGWKSEQAKSFSASCGPDRRPSQCAP